VQQVSSESTVAMPHELDLLVGDVFDEFIVDSNCGILL
jgi:hypothetical protein